MPSRPLAHEAVHRGRQQRTANDSTGLDGDDSPVALVRNVEMRGGWSEKNIRIVIPKRRRWWASELAGKGQGWRMVPKSRRISSEITYLSRVRNHH
jgi:hypothetical protein